MRGDDREQGSMFSYRSLEDRIPKDHPLRRMRALVDTALEEVSPLLADLYARTGRPSIPPERLLRALLLQILFSVRSERQLFQALQVFVKAGANVESSNCGPCFGSHMGVLSRKAQMISSSNRNYQGRMGSRDARIFLASPATVTASAIEGKLADPRKYL